MVQQAGIQRANITFIWTRTFFEFFQGNPLRTYPLDYLARIKEYKEKFTQIAKAEGEVDSLALPWEKKAPNSFWNYYFQGSDPQDVTANMALKRVMPLRLRGRYLKTSCSELKKSEMVNVEGFFYPHGAAAVMTIRLCDSPGLADLVSRALMLRRSWRFLVNPAEPERTYTLTGAGRYFLDQLCDMALGPKMGRRLSSPADPFSIVTVIKGSAAYSSMAVEQGGEIHQAMEQLTNWSDTWPSDHQPKLLERKFIIKNEQNNHYLYGTKRGRMVWFPQYFRPSQDESHRYMLRWYHLNLVHASLQSSSLGAFLAHTAKAHKENPAVVSEYQRTAARRAMEIIDELYQGSENTYRTWNTREQIEQNGFYSALEYLRQEI